MCKIGDIILVKGYTVEGIEVGTHSFVVVDDSNGEIEGMTYDMVCNVLSSIRSEEHREKVLKYQTNLEVSSADMDTKPHNGKDAYVKLNDLYFFNKSKTDYRVIGTLDYEMLNFILEYVKSAKFRITPVTENL